MRLGAADALRFAAGAPIAALPPELVPPAGRRPPVSLAAALALAVARAPREAPASLAAIYSRPSAAEEKHGAP
jgi:hypothetical protein